MTMQIVHVFEEADRKLWKEHMRAFFGVTPNDGDEYDPETQSYVVCYCGGRVYPLGTQTNGEWVGGVWHHKVRMKEASEDE